LQVVVAVVLILELSTLLAVEVEQAVVHIQVLVALLLKTQVQAAVAVAEEAALVVLAVQV
jgi:hypothetical protein